MFCTLSHSPPPMALTIANSGATGGARLLYSSSTSHPYTNLSSQRHVLFPLSPRRTLHVVSAKRFTSRTGRSDGKNKRGTTTTRDQEQDPLRLERTAEIENVGDGVAVDNVDDGYFLPKLPGDEPDFWEGEKWDFLGFFVEYLWAFGIGFAVCLYFLSPTLVKFWSFNLLGSWFLCLCCYKYMITRTLLNYSLIQL